MKRSNCWNISGSISSITIWFVIFIFGWMLEHGSKDQTSGRQNGFVRREFTAADVELDVTERHFVNNSSR
jgi:hypothetical protein